MEFEQITDVIAFHGEGPVWHASWGGLRMVDMLAGDILTIGDDGSVHRLATGSRIAAFVRPRTGGGYVVGVERGLALAESAFAAPRALPQMWSDANVRMNECGVDGAGRLYAGSMPYDRTPGAGKLYRIEADGSASVVLPHVTVSNGVDFSPDGSRIYYNDTSTGGTDVFDAGFTRRRQFHDGDGGRPDGLTVDSAGNVWCAMNRVGKVRLYSPEAEILGEWQLPVRGVTAVALGGEDWRDVFVTTSRETADEPRAGAVFHMRAEVTGQPTRAFAG
ncbi:MAG: SMP-30/gluconolactonase/LRE family protein [Actinomycetaceae bacterium]|nr:SMP-30/gluconolactonase/LRE family protein [Actinomycetaceae bacterium]